MIKRLATFSHVLRSKASVVLAKQSQICVAQQISRHSSTRRQSKEASERFIQAVIENDKPKKIYDKNGKLVVRKLDAEKIQDIKIWLSGHLADFREYITDMEEMDHSKDIHKYSLEKMVELNKAMNPDPTRNYTLETTHPNLCKKLKPLIKKQITEMQTMKPKDSREYCIQAFKDIVNVMVPPKVVEKLVETTTAGDAAPAPVSSL
jgi:hypothetical protein